jgi:phenylpropionate dioxygenase-like ring-hydroxylating dioxygenase large terminal subunit
VDRKVARFDGGPSTSEIIRQERHHNSLTTAERYRFLGDADLLTDRYVSPDYYRREMRELWPQTWQWACREEEMPEPGDYVVYDIGRRSFIVIRDDCGTIRAFYNSCMHRGTQLLAPGAAGAASRLTCPFHGWRWDLTGRLQYVHEAWDVPHACPGSHDLPQIRVETWGGFVFINMDPKAPGLREYMDVIPDHLNHFRLDDRYISLYVSKELDCNWKAALEAFLEAYHVHSVHPELLGATSDSNGQYDVFGPHVTRRVAAAGTPSPNLGRQMSQQEIVDFMTKDGRTRAAERLVVAEGETARSVIARYLRGSIERTYRVDLSSYPDCDIIDTLEYHLFPNMMVFANFSLSMAYRFRPLDDREDRTVFDLVFLRPCAPGQPRPAPAERIVLKSNESFTTVPDLAASLGPIYDQDTAILSAQQRGFYAASRPAITLANYQEARIRNFENTVDAYLEGRRPTPTRGLPHDHR